MLIDGYHDKPYVYIIEHKGIFTNVCYANEDSNHDQTASSDAPSKPPKSATESILDITNDPGGAFGGDR